jgi:ribosomal protein L32
MFPEMPNLSILSLLIPCVSFLIIGGGAVVLGIFLLNKRKKEMREAHPAASQEPKMKTCSSCGAKNPVGNYFCDQCGAALGK